VGGVSRQPIVKPFIEREGNPEIAGTDTQLNFRFQAAVKISAAGYQKMMTVSQLFV
jgi:hypothetical protein